MEALRSRYHAMTPRERFLVGFATAALLLVIVHSLLWEPWQDALEDSRYRIAEKRETLRWVAYQADAIRPLLVMDRSQENRGGVPLLTLIERSANRAQLRGDIKRITPGEDGEVSLWLSDADFDKWIVWLDLLRLQGVEVVEAKVSRARGGVVTIRVTLL